TRDVRFGPKADIGSLFDHPVGALLEMHRHVEAKRLSGFQIDHQLEFDRSLDGKLTWLLALKDAIDIRGRSPKIIDWDASVRKQAADVSRDTLCRDGRDAVASQQRCDLLAMRCHEGVWPHEKATI